MRYISRIIRSQTGSARGTGARGRTETRAVSRARFLAAGGLLSSHKQYPPRPSGGLCYDKHHVWTVTVTVTIPDKLLCVLRGGIRKNFRINPLQRGFVEKFSIYRHLSREKVRLNRC
jgi:hypothetical protein